jgi:hypothetical protein
VLPTTWLSVLFYVLLVAPGLLYDLLLERRRVKARESAFREVSRTVLASLIISVIAFGILAIVRAIKPAWMPDPRQLFSHTGGYLARHYPLVLRTLLIEGGIALGIAAGFQLVRFRRSDARLRPVSTWTRVLREELPAGFLPHVEVRLSDGTTYIGQVGHFTADLENSDRELVLVPLLFAQAPGGQLQNLAPEWQRLVISGDSVKSMAVQYRPDPNASAARPQGHLGRFWRRVTRLCRLPGRTRPKGSQAPGT